MKQYSKWDKFELPQLTERDYGVQWPAGTVQLAKELICFKMCRMGQRSHGMQPALIHFLNIQRMLWPNMVELYKDVPKGRIWNNYYLDVAESLCNFDGSGQDRNVLTGPASANKTYCVASYVVASFFMAPNETLAMVSTTSGSASERRIWADIKDFHENGMYSECNYPKAGSIIEYLKAIVFDEGMEIGGSDKVRRDFRNGIQVIPIATDSTGESALTTIQGSKNKFIIWALDEMAQMNSGVTRPCGNLAQNPHFHFIGIGNANDLNDPHAKDCMPMGGIDGLNIDSDRRWESATGKQILFLHGDESPNNHPFVDQSIIKKVTDYPFPYASNKLSAEISAKEYGHGNIDEGKQTIDYWKFCIGFWPPASSTNSLYTKSLFSSYNAHLPADGLVNARTFGAADFGFNAGGDANSFMTATVGWDDKGRKLVLFAKDSINIRSKATDKNEFVNQVAKGYIDEIHRHKIKYSDFGGDTGNDASLTFTAMSKLAGTFDFHGISSVGNSSNPKKYVNKVTELWFRARDLIKTGCVRGINFEARYYSQLIQRRYSAKGKNCFEIERKRDMKKRIGRSPDDADTFIYLCWMIIRSGIFDQELSEIKEIKTPEEEYEEYKGYSTFDPVEFRARQRQQQQANEFQLTDYQEQDDDYASL